MKRKQGELYVITKLIETPHDDKPEVSVVLATRSRTLAKKKLHKLKSVKRATWLPNRTFEMHPIPIAA